MTKQKCKGLFQSRSKLSRPPAIPFVGVPSSGPETIFPAGMISPSPGDDELPKLQLILPELTLNPQIVGIMRDNSGEELGLTGLVTSSACESGDDSLPSRMAVSFGADREGVVGMLVVEGLNG